MDVSHKLQVLCRIAEAFNTENITWAVGASLLMFLKGITSDFHDIDIMIAEEGAIKTRDILSSMGTLHTSEVSATFQSKIFMEFIIDKVEVDVIGGFRIINDDGTHYFPLSKEMINEVITIDSTSIPLQSLVDWRLYYQLMGRQQKAELIDTYLKHNH